MNLCTLVFGILLTFGAANPPEEHEVNEGASTSGQLTVCEMYEIMSYAESMAHLILAEDLEGDDLRIMVDRRFIELEAFFSEFTSILTLVENGAQAISDIHRRLNRLKLFGLYIQSALLEAFFGSCLEHQHFRRWYVYDHETNMITIRENRTLNRNIDICGSYQESLVLKLPPLILYSSPVELTHQIVTNNNHHLIFEVQQYHVIPLPLIHEFLRTWLSEDLSSPEYNGISDCARTFYGRFRRSIQKILIVAMKNSLGFIKENLNHVFHSSSTPSYDAFYSHLVDHGDLWLSGNTFLGPPNRLDNPQSGRNETELMKAFEYGAEPIIGRNRYRQLHHLFQILTEYVKNVHEVSPFERSTSGLGVFLVMLHFTGRYDVTPLNLDQWEERVILNQGNGKCFISWIIKKKSDRFPRHTDYRFEVNRLDYEKLSIKDQFKSQWSTFITDLMKISVQDINQHMFSSWMRNLTCLYSSYLHCKAESKDIDCSNCTSFDSFLYSEISSRRNELICDSKNSSNQLCQAWMQIVMNSAVEIQMNKDEKLKENIFSDKKSELYFEDVEIIMRWLSSIIKSNKYKKPKLFFIKSITSLDKIENDFLFELFDDSIDTPYFGYMIKSSL